MKYSSQEAGIPILTEIIRTPTTTAPDRQSETGETGQTIPTSGAAELGAGPDWDADQLNTLTNSVREVVLRQLREQLDEALGERVRVRVAQALQDAASDMAAEIKKDLLQELDKLAAAAATEMFHEFYKKTN